MEGTAEDNGEYIGRTVVLVGKAGSGKTSTGNLIVGGANDAFEPGVTTNCEFQCTAIQNCILSVIDTPGLLNVFTDEHILEVLKLANDGIHAFLVVLSLSSRFLNEIEAVIGTLANMFGSRVKHYLIFAFCYANTVTTDGDNSNEAILKDKKQELEEVLETYGHEKVLYFDNKGKEESKKAETRELLLTYIKDVLNDNGGRPYTHEPA